MFHIKSYTNLFGIITGISLSALLLSSYSAFASHQNLQRIRSMYLGSNDSYHSANYFPYVTTLPLDRRGYIGYSGNEDVNAVFRNRGVNLQQYQLRELRKLQTQNSAISEPSHQAARRLANSQWADLKPPKLYRSGNYGIYKGYKRYDTFQNARTRRGLGAQSYQLKNR